MDSGKLTYVLGLLVLGFAGCFREVKGSEVTKFCGFPAIYNFGDSNSDTGAISAAFTGVQPPNGQNFKGDLSGRLADGRLLIDYICEELKLPYLSAYLNSIGSNYKHGANFATGGSSIRQGGYSPFHLEVQISQFLQFKSRTTLLYSHGKDPSIQNTIPIPDDFSKALYTFDIGQNDLSYGFQHTSLDEVTASLPVILTQFSQAVNRLYYAGARFFWIHNTGPIGCLPYSYIYYKAIHGNLDKNGCVKPQNDIAQEFNKQLKKLVFQLRKDLPLAAFTYVDVYSVKYELISNAKNQGFVDPLEFCCGSYYGYHVDCGKKAIVNGTVYGNPCRNPSRHISWDGIHYSQAANLWIARHILNGSFSDPPIQIGKACHHLNK